MSISLALQCMFGIQCKDFAILAADQMNMQSVLVMKNDVDKLFEISDKIVLGVNGEPGDIAQFTQLIAKNLDLYKMRNKYELNTAAVTHFTRRSLCEGSGVGSPYVLNSMVCGYDEDSGSQLYTVDFLGSCLRLPYAAHGLGGLLGFSILDTYYKPDLSELEAYNILKMCVREVQQRLFMNLPNFKVKSVSKLGIKTLPSIKPEILIQN